MTSDGDLTGDQAGAVYAILHEGRTLDHALLALARLRPRVARLVVVVSQTMAGRFGEVLAGAGADEIVEVPDATSLLLAYRAGLTALATTGQGPVLLTGSHVFGPILRTDGTGTLADLMPGAGTMVDDGVALLSSYWHAPQLDPRLIGRTELSRIACLDFALAAPTLVADPLWQDFWAGAEAHATTREGMVVLSERLAAAGHTIAYPCPETTFEVAEPEIFEVHKLIPAGSPCLPVAAIMLDPLIHDLGAIELRRAIDDLRRVDPALYTVLIGFATRNMALRDFTTVADQYEILPETATGTPDRVRDFGAVAVFIHAFYANMMPEFWGLIERLPGDSHLFVTTATDDDRAQIETFLGDRDAGARATVRVVEHNRGRDMASLFITWRDVVLSGDYPVALRLHSKRTPQVPRQVGESFKYHLFDNLAATPGYVSNVLDMMEAEPDVGLVIPPVIHMGFGTLGHAWHNNRPGVAAALKRMGIDIWLDHHTPVAAYGTMYWFRTDALRDMFETVWGWEEYNAEPNHIDGGLAHVQERLIAYCVQHRGFRTVSIMTPRHAARGYARLEYKLQLLAAHLPTGNILEQSRQIQSRGGQMRLGLYGWLIKRYGRLVGRHPWVRRYLAKPGRVLGRLLLADRSAHR